MENPLGKMSTSTRAWIYGVVGAGIAVAVGYGALETEQAALWLAFAGAILVPTMALSNMSTASPTDELPLPPEESE